MNRLRYLRRLAAILVILGSLTSAAWAQQGSVPLYHENLPPGVIGHLQHMKGRGITGYFQPVEVMAPQGTEISLVIDGHFGPDQPAPVKFGCLIGGVYRFRVSHIPLHPGRELYPSVEVIDRLYPPPGLELKHPIPIHLTRDELELALAGKFVTRVIYLEPPRDALPIQQEREAIPYFEVAPGADPIQVADNLGRPIAILRIGSRAPVLDDPEPNFNYNSPPMMLYMSDPQAGLEPPPEMPVEASLQRRPDGTTGLPARTPQPRVSGGQPLSAYQVPGTPQRSSQLPPRR